MTVQTPPPRKPSAWPRWDREPTQSRKAYERSALVGLAATVLIHLFLVFAFPWDMIKVSDAEQPEPNLPMEVELVIPEPVEEPPPKFVETNTQPPEQEPEDTNNISDRNQVVAQENPVENAPELETPQVDGEMPSQKIVEGDLNEEPSPPPVEQGMPDAQPEQQPEQQEQPTEAEPVEEQVEEQVEPQDSQQPVEAPSEGEDDVSEQERAIMPEQEAVEEEGTPSTDESGLSEELPETPGEEEKEAAPAPRPQREIQVKMKEVTPSQQAPQGQMVPKARPTINIKRPPGPVMSTPASSSDVGALSINAKFSEFGSYTQQMMDAIQAQWNLTARQTNYVSSQYGTYVKVEFTLLPNGHVTNFQILRSTASRPATLLVQDAVISRAPFGEWTKEMLSTLGDQEKVTITFYYR